MSEVDPSSDSYSFLLQSKINHTKIETVMDKTGACHANTKLKKYVNFYRTQLFENFVKINFHGDAHWSAYYASHAPYQQQPWIKMDILIRDKNGNIKIEERSKHIIVSIKTAVTKIYNAWGFVDYRYSKRYNVLKVI